MAGAIAEPRDRGGRRARPKIVSIEIPIDKIGEVIGPKGKVINTLQQETGADIAVDDDGMVGTVTIGAKDGNAVEEARRRISTDPRPADGRGGRRLRRARSSTSPSSARSSTSCPGGTACCTSRSWSRPGQAHRTAWRTCSPGPAGRGPRGRHRPAGQGVPIAGFGARGAGGAATAATGATAPTAGRPVVPAATATVRRPLLQVATARGSPSRTRSRPS